MNAMQTGPNTMSGAAKRFARFPLIRILVALLFVLLPWAAMQFVLEDALSPVWLALLSAVFASVMYGLYVRLVERRPCTELSARGAGPDLAHGAVIGAVLFCLTVDFLYMIGVYQITGTKHWTVMLTPLIGMIAVGVLEEILFRGILFRMLDNWLGSSRALPISLALFALPHLMSGAVTLLSVLGVVAAGLLLSAAFMLTRRLWLGVGIHAAWNFTQGGFFSMPVSGHNGGGFVEGMFTGPAWLTGGAFGVEGSVPALMVLVIGALVLLAGVRQRQLMLVAQ